MIQDPPTWTQAGINYVGDDGVILQCYAPGKDYMYAVGDFSGWAEQEEFLMRKSLDKKAAPTAQLATTTPLL